jgi:hypothetical protein
MELQYTALFILLQLLNGSVSSFGSRPLPFTTSKSYNNRLPFLISNGGSGYIAPSDSKCFASVGTSSDSKVTISSENLELLSERGRKAILRLIEEDTDGAQRHVYAEWPEPGTEDEGKIQLADQVRFDVQKMPFPPSLSMTVYCHRSHP